jgi:hypothetical protein
MEDAIKSGACQVIGVGRPLCGSPGCVGDLLDGSIDALPAYENTLSLPWYLGFMSWFTFFNSTP